MTTARALLHQCRKAGIILVVDGDGIAFDAPPGVAVPVADLTHRKAELLTVLRGDYSGAALALVLSVDDPERRAELACMFDERAGICEHDGGMSRGEAERLAYEQLAEEVEAVTEDWGGLDQLTPWTDTRGRRCWIRRDLLHAEHTLNDVELVSWVLNRVQADTCREPGEDSRQAEAGAELRKQCRELAEAAGWPSIQLRPGERIVGTNTSWQLFCERAWLPDVTAALNLLPKRRIEEVDSTALSVTGKLST